MVVSARARQRMSLLCFQPPYMLLQVIFLIYMLAYIDIALHTFYREIWPKSSLNFLHCSSFFSPFWSLRLSWRVTHLRDLIK